MSTKHTPGPWRIHKHELAEFGDTNLCSFAVTGREIDMQLATVISYRVDEHEANARLIAAAPDLLKALKTLLPMYEDWHSDWPSQVNPNEEPALRAAREAIAKATGVTE